MSIKVYDGKLIDTTDIFAFAEKLHKEITETYHRLSQELVMDQVVQYLSDIPKKHDSGLSLITNVEMSWKKRQNSLPNHSFDHDPLGFELCIGKTMNGKIIAKPYYSHKAYETTLLNMPEVKDYGYWNNSDREEGVSKSEWKLREKEWLSIVSEECDYTNLLQYKLASDNPFKMLTYHFISNKPIDAWLDVQPSPEDRLRRAARKHALAPIKSSISMKDLFRFIEYLDSLPIETIGKLPSRLSRADLVTKDVNKLKIELNLESIQSQIDQFSF